MVVTTSCWHRPRRCCRQQYEGTTDDEEPTDKNVTRCLVQQSSGYRGFLLGHTVVVDIDGWCLGGKQTSEDSCVVAR